MQQKTLEKNKNSHKCLESNYLPKTRTNFTHAQLWVSGLI